MSSQIAWLQNLHQAASFFSSEIVGKLRNKITSFSENEKFVLLLMGEMKIQENLF